MSCEDFPACNHEPGCCPDFDASGRQLNMKCVCGATVPLHSRSSLCQACLQDPFMFQGEEGYEPEDFDGEDEYEREQELEAMDHDFDNDYGDQYDFDYE